MGSEGHDSLAVSAGRVGRPHGLDGSFHVTGARSRLLALGTEVTAAGRTAKVIRRAGTDEHPIVRLEGVEDRDAVRALRGCDLSVELVDAPALGEDEWWASELEGCEVVDGARRIGVVTRLVELPSCEALEVCLAMPDARAGGVAGSEREILVPMVRAAIRHVDVAQRRIDVDMAFIGEAS
jgi:16S rRNA processing protein RimM